MVATAADSLLVHDVAAHIRGVLTEEIAELIKQGIEVDYDNEPAPENAQPTPNTTVPVLGSWVTPTTCPRRADPNYRNSRGTLKQSSWAKIRDMDELELFRLCLPE